MLELIGASALVSANGNEVHMDGTQAGLGDGRDIRGDRILDRGDEEAVHNRAFCAGLLRNRIEVEDRLARPAREGGPARGMEATP